MIKIKLLRNNPKLIASQLWRRMFFLNIKKVILKEMNRKFLQIKIDNLKYNYKFFFSKFNYLNKIKFNCIIKKKKKFLTILKKIDSFFKKMKKTSNIYLSNIPNILHISVPYGLNYENNRVISKFGKIRKNKFKDYMKLRIVEKELDWENAAKITGSKFVFIKGKIALLHRALIQFMLDIHTLKHKYLETYVPYLTNEKSLYCTGQLPKFKNNLFYISNFNKNIKYTLIPTGEIPLTNFVRNKTLSKKHLPIMLTTNTPCFRLESKTYGSNVKGLIRMYQFDKVELVQIVSKKISFYTLELIVSHAEKILKLLKLPYRKILLCAGETGFSSTKTYDLEVWFPSKKKYKEVSSCSNMITFQSRRLNSFYLENKKKKLLHTLNGSGLAISRILAALLENFQNQEGKIKIPEVLRDKYMNGMKFI